MHLLDRFEGKVHLIRGNTELTARAMYEVRESPVGMRDWRGFIRDIEPGFTLEPSAYELVRQDGTRGRILISNIKAGFHQGETATFVGNGPAPGF
jgi:hypothetical protein